MKLAAAVSFLTAVLLVACAAAQSPAIGATGVESEVKALSEDIELLQQINGVGLSADQLRQFVEIVKRRAALHQSYAPKRQELLNALAQVLRQKRALLLADKPVPEAMDERIARLNTELNALTQAERQQAEALVGEVRKLLTPVQLAALTGREEARESALEMLQWLRRLNDAQYEEEAQAAAEELETPERGLTSKDIRKIFDQARKMSEDEFIQQADALAEKLLPAYSVSEAAETQIILDLISHPRLLPLLQDKLAAMHG